MSAYLVLFTALVASAILCFRVYVTPEQDLRSIAFAGGAIFSLLLFCIAWTQVNARAAAERLSERLLASEENLLKLNAELERKVHEHKAVEDLLAHERELLRTLLDHSPDCIYFKDRESRFLRCGKSVAQRLGVADTTSLIGKTDFDFFTDEHALEAFDIEQEIIRTKQPVVNSVEKETWKDGRITWVLTSKMPLFDKHGNVIGTFGMSKDITRLKQAEMELQEEKELLAVTLRSIGDAVVTTDTNGRIILFNTVAEELTGCSHAEAVGKPLSEVFRTINTTDTQAEHVGLIQRALAERQVITRDRGTVLLRPDGVERQIAESAAPIMDADGRLIGAVVVARDITEKVKSEAELLRASKLDSIGVLAGGIAHDFNNILTVVLGNISLARMLADALPPQVNNVLNEAEKASLRARELTQRLLTFAKGGAPIKRNVRPGSLLRGCVKAVLNGTEIQYECFIAEDLWSVNADEAQLAQVFHNLIQYAKSAAGDKPAIDIYASNQEIAHGSLFFLEPGKYVRISIRDHGAGLQPEQLNKIFDPYFSSKRQGNGLELATAYSIIRKHEGQIRVESIAGQGTVFHVYLPASSVPEAPPPPPVRATRRATHESILVMDDEEGIRELAMHMLRNAGYAPVVAADGGEAIAKYEAAMKRGHRFSAVIMDLTVPNGMGGLEAMRRLKSIDPGIKAIVSSGYSNDPVMANYRQHGFCGVVPKPYSAEDLAATLSEILADSPVEVGAS